MANKKAMCSSETPEEFINHTDQNPRIELLSSLRSGLFIVGTSLIIFTSLCNTITWHLQRFWGASGDFWKRQWEQIFYLFNGNDYNIIVWGTFVVTFLIYWGIGGLYTLIDLTGLPTFVMKYKIQDSSTPVKMHRVVGVVKQVLKNQFLVGMPFIMIAYYLLKMRGVSSGTELPTFQWVLIELGVFVILEEFAFYYCHRLLHNHLFYKYIHKQHHEWTSPIAITAVYCHPLEHVFSNLMPPFLGPIIMGSHIATIWLWFTIVIFSTLNAHSGYHFPLFPSPEAHDFHHLKFTQNFGILGIFDRLHGTDSLFRESSVYQRHLMLLSLVPLKQMYPEEKGKKI